MNIDNPKIQEIEGELRRLLLGEHPHAISILFRVFLEQSVDAYLERKGIPSAVNTKNGDKPKNLRAKVGDAIQAMVNDRAAQKDLNGIVKGIDDKNSPCTLIRCISTSIVASTHPRSANS